MIIVSACLLGLKCKYNSQRDNFSEKVVKLIKEGKAIPVCPEQLGGLPTPRVPAEIKNNKVITKDGRDVTFEFELGAKQALEIALLSNSSIAILKSRSPSCGCDKIYDGSFSKKLIKGDGIFCKILKKHNFKIYTEEDDLDFLLD